MGIQVGGVKGHHRIFALLDDINGQVMLHQLIGPLFGEGQKVAVQTAAFLQVILGQHRVRHGILVQRLFLSIRQLGGCGFYGLLADLFLHLLGGRLLQSLDHGQRRILNGLAAHAQLLADMADCCGTAHVGPIQLASVQLLHSCHIVECVVPAGVAGLNMEIGGIVQHQQGLPVLGAGLGTFSIERQRKLLIGVPGSIHAHRHRFIRHLQKVGVRFRLGQLFRFSHRNQMIQAIQQLSCFCGRFPRFTFLGELLEPVPNTAGVSAAESSGQLPQRILPIVHTISVFIGIIVKGKLVNVGSQLLDRVPLRFRGGGQVNAALLADFLVVTLDVVNQLAGSFVDGLQTGPQLFQLLALGPESNISEAVFAGLNTEILTNGIGNALGLNFLGVSVLGGLFHRRQIFLHLQTPLKLIFVHIAPAILGNSFFCLCFGGKVQAEVVLGAALAHHDDFPGRLRLILFGVMELAVCNLMDSGRNGLHLAHAVPDGDPLLVRGKITVHIGGHRLKLDRDRGRAAQRLQKRFIVRYGPGQAGGQLRQGLAVRLAHIEYLDRAEHGDFNFLFLHNSFAVCVQNSTAPCRNTGFGYAVFRSNAFVGASFIQMETDNFLFEFGCVTPWHDDSLFPVF